LGLGDNAGEFNVRTGVELSTAKVKTIQAPGAIVDVILSTSCKNSDGDTRVRMADQSGWCTLTFRSGEPLIEPLGTLSRIVLASCGQRLMNSCALHERHIDNWFRSM
jgi:hypothetical protein